MRTHPSNPPQSTQYPRATAERSVWRTRTNLHSARASCGFSLIELLAVIGVVAILIGLIVPALSGAMRSAKSVRCQANLRSIMTGMQAYRDARRGDIPWMTVIPSTVESPDPFGAIASYIGVPIPTGVLGEEIERIEPYACPADRQLSAATGFSYAYPPSSFMQVSPEQWSRADMIEILSLYTQPQSLGNGPTYPKGFAVFQDFARFHIPRARRLDYSSPNLTGMNLAFLDGSVRAGN